MLVKDVMTKKVVTVTTQTPVEEIARLLLDHHISAVPVVDVEGVIVGMVSEGDLMRRLSAADAPRRSWWLELFAGSGPTAADYVKTHGTKAADVMSRDIATVSEDMPIGEVARILETHRIKRVPVLRDGKLTGIVSRANLLHGLASLPPNPPETGADDRVLRVRLDEALAEVPGISVSLVNVIVRDGKASIWGVVDSDFEENAIRIAAESVVGAGHVDIQMGRLPAPGYGYGI
jgi:CBS domain-containing protein